MSVALKRERSGNTTQCKNPSLNQKSLALTQKRFKWTDLTHNFVTLAFQKTVVSFLTMWRKMRGNSKKQNQRRNRRFVLHCIRTILLGQKICNGLAKEKKKKTLWIINLRLSRPWHHRKKKKKKDDAGQIFGAELLIVLDPNKA